MTAAGDWRKSSRSQNVSNCVEVHRGLGGVRDSKNPGPALRGDVTALVRAVREGRIGH
jgi:Domain of unknown function (DUF397)